MADAAEILFDGAEVTRRYIDKNPLQFSHDMKALRLCKTDEEVSEWTTRQGARIISALGAEVDRLEIDIKTIRPEVKHIDLEIL